ncbi:MAG: hypothetical protein OES13_09250 [Acidimicrobiia bacterium]|nr:hypothetical protein [Acidimicrobiia bacterium]
MGAYDRFAEDYHWLLDDEQITGRPFVAAYEHHIAELPPGAAVLESALSGMAGVVDDAGRVRGRILTSHRSTWP